MHPLYFEFISEVIRGMVYTPHIHLATAAHRNLPSCIVLDFVGATIGSTFTLCIVSAEVTVHHLLVQSVYLFQNMAIIFSRIIHHHVLHSTIGEGYNETKHTFPLRGLRFRIDNRAYFHLLLRYVLIHAYIYQQGKSQTRLKRISRLYMFVNKNDSKTMPATCGH